ncbi:AAA family ATPase [Burkholderia gladioli]|uniref:AAA family ATPase n=1 Tax=Burkholderia gladioli TaxID=28095 RepID=UPI001C6019F1|nr:AAA family ATPase [Burkholderia gladioli]MBW5285303.1 AAA family ATPase [Burkholderia gladioli]
MADVIDIERQFADAVSNAGFAAPEIIADGKIHRFDGPEDRKGKKNAWYVLHADGLGAGAFGDWKTGYQSTWTSRAESTLSPAEREAWRARLADIRRAADDERKRMHGRAAAKALSIWERALDATTANPYCQTKRVKPYGLKEFKDRHTLIVPIRNTEKALVNLQFIFADGTKRFLSGGEKAGCCYVFGRGSRDRVLIVEGFATGASLHEATGLPVAVAFDAGNLLAVAKALRASMPRTTIIVCADDDSETDGNPGMARASEAAREIGGLVAVPDFGPARPSGATDFNDLAALDGLDALRRCIAAATAPGGVAKPVAAPRTMALLTRASDIVPEAIRWLWPDWLPEGKLTLLAGSPGTGKTTLALALAATVTRGGAWPDGTACRRAGDVLMWSGEDNPADTIVPRLIAAGADLHRVHIVSGRRDEKGETMPFDPATDVPLLAERLSDMGGASLLILDPIVAAVSGDAHRVNDVRRNLQSLVDMAAAYRCAVLGISHFAKGTKGSSPAERVIGSQAFVALARMVLVAGKDEAAERRILARAKSNIAPDDGGVSYTLEMVENDGIHASRVVWGDLIDGTAREILGDVEQQDDEVRTERTEATEFLQGLLADGPLSSKQIRKDADEAGFAWRTMHRAADALKVEKRKIGMKEGWQWALPKMPNPERASEDATLYTVASSGKRGTFGNHAGLRAVDFGSSAEDANRQGVSPSENSSDSEPGGDV